jgi:hypothetical protein
MKAEHDRSAPVGFGPLRVPKCSRRRLVNPTRAATLLSSAPQHGPWYRIEDRHAHPYVDHQFSALSSPEADDALDWRTEEKQEIEQDTLVRHFCDSHEHLSSTERARKQSLVSLH